MAGTEHLVWPNLPEKKVPRVMSEEEGLEGYPMYCQNCGHFLRVYQGIVIGFIKVMCGYCGVWHTLDIIPPDVIIENEVEEVGRPFEAQEDHDRP
jgi:hypothetical protein